MISGIAILGDALPGILQFSHYYNSLSTDILNIHEAHYEAFLENIKPEIPENVEIFTPKMCLRTCFILAEILAQKNGAAGAGRMALPSSTRISARLKRAGRTQFTREYPAQARAGSSSGCSCPR